MTRTTLHTVIEDSVKGKYFEFRRDYYKFVSLWSQEGTVGREAFSTDVYSSSGESLGTQRVSLKNLQSFVKIEEGDLPWKQSQPSCTERGENSSLTNFSKSIVVTIKSERHRQKEEFPDKDSCSRP